MLAAGHRGLPVPRVLIHAQAVPLVSGSNRHSRLQTRPT
jgi:hypothetical protein